MDIAVTSCQPQRVTSGQAKEGFVLFLHVVMMIMMMMSVMMMGGGDDDVDGSNDGEDDYHDGGGGYDGVCDSNG